MQRPTPVNHADSSTQLPESLTKRLEERRLNGNYRSLNPQKRGIDFFSNDYLGFSTSGLLKQRLAARENTSEPRFGEPRFGATGSRLLSGDSEIAHRLEAKIAKFHHAESALLFNCGYSANIGLIGYLPTRHDTVIYDELSHASIIEGARSATTKQCWSFRHNDVSDLEQKLSKALGDVYVVTESVFSMDGDFAPLVELSAVCKKFGAYLIVDEAHAVGLFGNQGNGRVSELSLEHEVFARVITYGKALGSHGAAVVGSKELINFLINFSKPFIYSTALDFSVLASIDIGYDLLTDTSLNNVPLFFLIHEFQALAKKECVDGMYLKSLSPIQGLIFNNNKECRAASEALAKVDIDARAILSPTVAAGKERIRIVLHTFNATTEVQLLFHTLKQGGFLCQS